MNIQDSFPLGLTGLMSVKSNGLSVASPTPQFKSINSSALNSLNGPTNISIHQFSSAAQSCLTLCDPTDCSTADLPVHHQFLEFTQTHDHWVSDAIQPNNHLILSPTTFNHSQHQSLFKWVSSLHQLAKVLEFQLQHQSFQWTPRTDVL